MPSGQLGITGTRAVSEATLPALAAVAAVPGYDRSAVTPGIVHIGVGGFHRAHEAVYLDRLMEATGDLRWGVCGVGVLEDDRAMQEALDAQDGLYTVVERDPDGTEAVRVVGSLVEVRLAPDDPEAVLERMAADTTHVVSLTITEGAYVVDPADAAGARPRTAFGLIAEALRRRRERGVAPFTVLSCDNVPGNGDLARACAVEAARLRDAALGGWVAREVAFPGSMVDRITPATTAEDRAALADRHGIDDRWPVVCEPYRQWVLEDAFSAARPPLEAVGVHLVDDVAPHELMKQRLLNGGHQALGYLARLAGHRFVHAAAQDPPLRALLEGYLAEEAAPTLPPVPGTDLGEYRRGLVERFGNPGVRDTVARLCAHGSDRVPAWVVPVAREQLARGGPVGRAALVVAAWARHCEGVTDDGEPLDVVDRRAEQLVARARRQRAEPLAFLADRELFGDLADDERFTAAYAAALTSLHDHGALGTVRALAGDPSTHDPLGDQHG